MFALWILIKPLLIGLLPFLAPIKRGAQAFLGDFLPTLIACAAVAGCAALFLPWVMGREHAPMVLVSEVENRQREAHVSALLAANRQLENTLRERDGREGRLQLRIVELEAQQRKARENAVSHSGSHLFSDDSEWMRAKRRRAERH